MKRLFGFLILFVSIAVLLTACGRGGGGDGSGNSGPQLQPQAYNLSGTWYESDNPNSNTCGVFLSPTYQNVTISQQSGSNSLIITDSLNQTFNCTMSGNQMTYSGLAYNPNCTSMTQSIVVTFNTSTHGSGTLDWTCSYSGGSCTGKDAVTLDKL